MSFTSLTATRQNRAYMKDGKVYKNTINIAMQLLCNPQVVGTQRVIYLGKEDIWKSQ